MQYKSDFCSVHKGVIPYGFKDFFKMYRIMIIWNKNSVAQTIYRKQICNQRSCCHKPYFFPWLFRVGIIIMRCIWVQNKCVMRFRFKYIIAVFDNAFSFIHIFNTEIAVYRRTCYFIFWVRIGNAD